MVSEESRINQYLFYEFGYDLQNNPSAVSDNWPFDLRTVGAISLAGQETKVLEFTAEEQCYYVLSGKTLSFQAVAGMSLQDLQLQHNGQAWIANQDPIDLADSRPLDKTIPSGLERRTAIEGLAVNTCSSSRILEGLYLREMGTYLALIEDTSTGEAIVVGTGLMPRSAPFPQASPWRRLAFAVGRMLDEGILREG
jgi:hypothetical protein